MGYNLGGKYCACFFVFVLILEERKIVCRIEERVSSAGEPQLQDSVLIYGDGEAINATIILVDSPV